ncbi:unnamed protein product, partial [Urochloa humidicola]
ASPDSLRRAHADAELVAARPPPRCAQPPPSCSPTPPPAPSPGPRVAVVHKDEDELQPRARVVAANHEPRPTPSRSSAAVTAQERHPGAPQPSQPKDVVLAPPFAICAPWISRDHRCGCSKQSKKMMILP